MIPLLPVTEPTIVTLPDGRQARITVELLGDDWPTKAPLPPQPAQPAAAPIVSAPRRSGPVQVPPAPPVSGPLRPSKWMDHPVIGGKITVFVLTHGDFPDMHRRCLGALLATTSPDRVELRVHANDLGAASLAYVEGLEADGRIASLYRAEKNLKKYPAMREMLHDPKAPIKTPWMVWLDDDTFADKDPNWLDKLAESVAKGTEVDPRLGMVGAKLFSHLNAKQIQWVTQASWYRKRPLQDRHGRDAPGSPVVHFCVGAFWAMKTECVKTCDVPDVRLSNNGGDVAIGEALHQNGYTFKQLPGTKKELVNWSAVPRRGASESMFGL